MIKIASFCSSFPMRFKNNGLVQHQNVEQVKKLPESRAINPSNSDTMEKLKLKLITKAKMFLTINGSKCKFAVCQCA